ncbi:hypothetical protein ACPYPG_03605 [Streptomyces sp. FR-108]|uniref:hypothetical protein n=1 Tax=Streptomyces sp. FR-108 TaxID=3416665 RepID=UPI003CF8D382
MADTSARYRCPEAGQVAVVGVTPVAVSAGLIALYGLIVRGGCVVRRGSLHPWLRGLS